MAQAQQVIELLTDEKGSFIHDEALSAAGSTIVPGDLVEVTNAGEVQEQSVAAADAQRLFALTNLPVAGTIDDAYTAGATVRYGAAHAGQKVNGRVAASATAITEGAGLEAAGDGTLRLLAAGVKIAVALEAVDNSGGGTVVRIAAQIV